MYTKLTWREREGNNCTIIDFLTISGADYKPSNYGHGKVCTKSKHSARQTKKNGTGYDDRFSPFVVRHQSPDVAGKKSTKEHCSSQHPHIVTLIGKNSANAVWWW